MSHSAYLVVVAGLWVALGGAVALGVWATITGQSGGLLLLVALLTWLLASFHPVGRFLLVIPLLATALGVIRLARPRPVSAAVLVAIAVTVYAVQLVVRV